MMLRMRGADYHQADDDDEHDEEHDDENDDDDDDDEQLCSSSKPWRSSFSYVASVPLDPTGNAEDVLS